MLPSDRDIIEWPTVWSQDVSLTPRQFEWGRFGGHVLQYWNPSSLYSFLLCDFLRGTHHLSLFQNHLENRKKMAKHQAFRSRLGQFPCLGHLCVKTGAKFGTCLCLASSSGLPWFFRLMSLMSHKGQEAGPKATSAKLGEHGWRWTHQSLCSEKTSVNIAS